MQASMKSFLRFRISFKVRKGEPLLTLQAGVSIIHPLCLFKPAFSI